MDLLFPLLASTVPPAIVHQNLVCVSLGSLGPLNVRVPLILVDPNP